jgi:hypothetical protein
VVKYKLVSVIAMCTGRHLDLLNETWIRHRMVPPGNYLIPPTLLALADEVIE